VSEHRPGVFFIPQKDVATRGRILLMCGRGHTRTGSS